MDEQYYQEYAQQAPSHWWFQARRNILEAVLKRYLPQGNSIKILEVGTGPGGVGELLNQYGWFVGLDMHFPALKAVQGKLQHLATGQLEALPFADHSFDAVFACDVLEHLEQEEQALSELKRVSQAGGKLFLTVPACPSLWSVHDDVNHHQRRYTRATLGQLLQTNHFQIERISYFNSLLFPPIAAARWIQRLTSNGGKPQSDLSRPAPEPLNTLLKGIFSLEQHWLPRWNLPIGVSLLCIASPQS